MRMTITTSQPHMMENGMVVEMSGRFYKVVFVPDRLHFIVRRTFRQWLSDVWEGIRDILARL